MNPSIPAATLVETLAVMSAMREQLANASGDTVLLHRAILAEGRLRGQLMEALPAIEVRTAA